jgi:ubiquinone/menaquinone biosynthesis C-methylase UbiE
MNREPYLEMVPFHQTVYQLWPDREDLRRRVTEELQLALQPFQAPWRVLEIGCGEGEQTEFLLQIEGIQLLALDCEEAMVSRVRERFGSHRDRGSLRVITADALDFTSEETFFGVVASWMIHNFRSRERTQLLMKIAEILEPGGCLILMDKVLPDNKSVRRRLWREHQRIHRSIGLVDPVAGAAIARHEKRDWSPGYRILQSKFLDELEEVFGTRPAIHVREGADVVISVQKTV